MGKGRPFPGSGLWLVLRPGLGLGLARLGTGIWDSGGPESIM
jgi:hypothetical protein